MCVVLTHVCAVARGTLTLWTVWTRCAEGVGTAGVKQVEPVPMNVGGAGALVL